LTPAALTLLSQSALHSPLGPSPPTHSHNAIADTGATGHFLSLSAPVANKRVTTTPISVVLPDGSTIHSTHTGHLLLSHALPATATLAHIFPALGSTSLLSIGQLCDHGCTAVFTADTVAIHLHDELLLKGHRSSTAPTLWTIPLQVPPPSTQLAATAVNTSTKPPDLVAFAHASLFSPALTTLAQALRKDYVVGFPGLTSPTLAKYPPMSMATAKGHLDQARQHPHRVSAPPGFTPNPSDPDHLDFFPSSETPINQLTHLCFSATIQATGQISSDQTGKFPLPSSTGNNYIFVLYDYDSNSIHAVAIKNRSAPSILAAYKIVFQRLTRAGLTP